MVVQKMNSEAWKKVWPYAAAIGTLLLIWQIAALFSPPYLIPSVLTVLERLSVGITEPEFVTSLKDSLFRLVIGYPSACLLGGLLGLLAGLSKGFAVYLRSLIAILQSIPPITWIPFLIILFGFGNVPIITVIIIASFFPMALSVMNATEGINRTHLEVAKVLGATKGQLLQKVYLPETLPSFITGAQVSFGNAWRSLIASEMVGGASSGLGFSIQFAGEVAQMIDVLMYIVIIGLIAAFFDHVVLEWLKRRMLKWRYIGGLK
jgi:NitT/TauT family transport system permease protein